MLKVTACPNCGGDNIFVNKTGFVEIDQPLVADRGVALAQLPDIQAGWVD